jgi:hypothetical protein
MSRTSKKHGPGPRKSTITESSQLFDNAYLSVMRRRARETAPDKIPELWVECRDLVAQARAKLRESGRPNNYWTVRQEIIRGGRTSEYAGRAKIRGSKYLLEDVVRTLSIRVPLREWLWLSEEDQRLFQNPFPSKQTGFFESVRFFAELASAILSADQRPQEAYFRRIRAIPPELQSDTDKRLLELDEQFERIKHDPRTVRQTETPVAEKLSAPPVPAESPHPRAARRTPSRPRQDRVRP